MAEMSEGLSPEAAPDTSVDVKSVFGIDTKLTAKPRWPSLPGSPSIAA
jgi:hypothetical protein